MLTAQEERKDSMTSPLPRKGSKAKQIATTQPATKNNPNQLLFVWYYYRLKINTTTPHHLLHYTGTDYDQGSSEQTNRKPTKKLLQF
jgi:hypothetical protein